MYLTQFAKKKIKCLPQFELRWAEDSRFWFDLRSEQVFSNNFTRSKIVIHRGFFLRELFFPKKHFSYRAEDLLFFIVKVTFTRGQA